MQQTLNSLLTVNSYYRVPFSGYEDCTQGHCISNYFWLCGLGLLDTSYTFSSSCGPVFVPSLAGCTFCHPTHFHCCSDVCWWEYQSCCSTTAWATPAFTGVGANHVVHNNYTSFCLVIVIFIDVFFFWVLSSTVLLWFIVLRSGTAISFFLA